MTHNPPPMSFALAAAAAMLLAGSAMQASEADDQIEASFKRTYIYRTYLKHDSVTATVKGGVLTLTGKVQDTYHRALAQEMASGLPGITSVDNRLAIKDAATTEGDDTWIQSKVRIALLLHRNVDSAKTTIEVKGGVVVLTGEASSLAQKELTGEYAKDIDGVKDVKNEMTVRADVAAPERTIGEKIDDASIASQVKMALTTHRSTSWMKTKVEVRSGEVTLTGIAKNAAEKALVSKLVSDIQGVDTVNNMMTIQEPVAK